jgi:hypothetical protein
VPQYVYVRVGESTVPSVRGAEPHHFNAGPDLSFHLNAAQDPTFHFNSDLDPDQSDANLPPLVYRPSMTPFEPSLLHCEIPRPSTAPF